MQTNTIQPLSDTLHTPAAAVRTAAGDGFASPHVLGPLRLRRGWSVSLSHFLHYTLFLAFFRAVPKGLEGMKSCDVSDVTRVL